MNKFEEKVVEYSPYFNEISRRLARVGIFFLLILFFGFFATVPLFKVISSIFNFEHVTIITVSPFQFLDLAMNTGISLAIILSFPLLVHQIYQFLKHGLTSNEKLWFFLLLPVIFILFALGFLYGFITLYSTFDAIAKINESIGMQNYWDISKLLSQVFITSSLLGVLFEFPLVLSVLIRMGFVDISYLQERRRHAVALIFVGTSLLPPTDGVSLLLMVVPLVVLYELTIALNSRKFIEFN